MHVSERHVEEIYRARPENDCAATAQSRDPNGSQGAEETEPRRDASYRRPIAHEIGGQIGRELSREKTRSTDTLYNRRSTSDAKLRSIPAIINRNDQSITILNTNLKTLRKYKYIMRPRRSVATLLVHSQLSFTKLNRYRLFDAPIQPNLTLQYTSSYTKRARLHFISCSLKSLT